MNQGSITLEGLDDVSAGHTGLEGPVAIEIEMLGCRISRTEAQMHGLGR